MNNSTYTGLQKLTNPFLIDVDSEYWTADIKVMIFGQETNDWGTLGNSSIDELLKWYNDFYWTGYCYKYGGYFWNYYKWLVQSIKSKHLNKKVSIIWNNIVKVGKEGEAGRPEEYLCDLQRDVFARPVIMSEINILKPDIVIFLTGPNYDLELTKIFGEIKFSTTSQSLSSRQCATISSPYLPEKCLRTYHPGYLIRDRKIANETEKAILEFL